MLEIIKYKNIFLCTTLIFTVLAVAMQVVFHDRLFNAETANMQCIGFVIFIISTVFAYKLEIKSLFYFILFYQLGCSLLLRFYFILYAGDELGYAETIIDSGLYRDLAISFKDRSYIDLYYYLTSEGYSASDLGFPFFIQLAYSIGGAQYGNLVMIIFNSICHTLSTYMIYRLSLKFLSSNESKIIAVFWGLNLISIWLNVSGLKETIFSMIVIYTMFIYYKFYYNKSIRNLALFVMGVVGVWFFRYYLSLFFILVFIAPYVLRASYKKLLPTLLILGFVFAMTAISILGAILPELSGVDNALEQRSSEMSLIERYLTYFLAFIGPVPTIINATNVASIIFAITVFVKMILNGFGIYGIYIILKEKLSRFYPLLIFFTLNTILIIITGFSLNYRYSYLSMPFFIIISVYGFSRYKEFKYGKLCFILYTLFVFALIVLFNFRK